MRLAIGIAGAVIGAIAGLLLGYFPATVVACLWLWPTSNLCGLPVVFTTAPLGVIVGAVAGWFLARRAAP